jgi:hypothetical protein
MQVDPHDLAATYAAMAESQLLDIARAYDTLCEPAQSALRAEFSRRNLEPPLIEEDEPEPLNATDYVTVQRYRDLSEAIVARTLVESAGIPVYLRDENLVRIDWQLSNFLGGIRLQVLRQDEQAAIELLSQPVPDPIAQPGESDFAQPHCPVCGSIQVTFQGSGRAAAITSVFLLGIPLPPGAKSWLCDSCGARWQNTDDDT